MTSLTVEVQRRGSQDTVLVASGEVDLSTAEVLREALIKALAEHGGGGERLVVDLADVGLLDSVGLGVLVGAHRRAAKAGAQMTVLASSTVRRSLQLSGLDQLLHVEDPPA